MSVGHKISDEATSDDNEYDYGETDTFSISSINKEEVMIIPFCGYICGWLKLIILREGRIFTKYLKIKYFHKIFTPSPFLAMCEIKHVQQVSP